MKIQQSEAANAAQIGQIQSMPAATQPEQTSATASTASPAATVSFSPQAQDIATAKAAVNAAPDVRDTLVASLKSRVESGQYNVSGSDVADMMMRRMAADKSAG